MKLLGYLRISTDGQADGFGLDVQRQLVEGWAAANGHKVVGWHQDICSGSVEAADRPGLVEVIEALRAKRADGVAMMSLDRLGRRLVVSEAALGLLRQTGGRVFCADAGEVDDQDDDETRILVRQVLSAIAEFEARKIVRRMQAGRAAKAAGGGFAYGSPRFGQRSDGGELVTDGDELATVALMREWQSEGLSIRAVCERANEAGLRAKRGGRWHPQTVARVLARA